MKRSLLRTLALLGLVLPGAVVLAAPSSADPELSTGCTSLHLNEASTLSSTGDIVINGDFTAGEQVRFTMTTPGTPALVVVAPQFGGDVVQGTSGQPMRYTISTSGSHAFRLTTSQSPQSGTLACGIPPTVAVSAPAPGATYAAGQSVATSFTCTAGTNAVAACDGPASVDTATAGAHQLTVVATDTAGLRSVRTVSYTVAKKPQTITFPDAPAGLVWGRDRIPLTAYSSSGLPVTYALDPASTGCSGPYPYFFNQAVGIERPGTCIVHADQAGNDEYDAAPTQQMSFTIGKRPSYLAAAKVTKGLLNLFPTTFKATLRVDDVMGPGSVVRPHAGQPVVFTVDGDVVCTGTTDVNGEARCTTKLGWTKTVNATGYTATWAGDDLWAASTATGVLK